MYQEYYSRRDWEKFHLQYQSYRTFALFSQLGIPTYGIRACAKVRDNRKELSKTVQELFIINIVMCICTYIAFTIVLYSVPRFKEESQLFWIISTTIIFNSIGMEWLYKAL